MGPFKLIKMPHPLPDLEGPATYSLSSRLQIWWVEVKTCGLLNVPEIFCTFFICFQSVDPPYAGLVFKFRFKPELELVVTFYKFKFGLGFGNEPTKQQGPTLTQIFSISSFQVWHLRYKSLDPYMCLNLWSFGSSLF